MKRKISWDVTCGIHVSIHVGRMRQWGKKVLLTSRQMKMKLQFGPGTKNMNGYALEEAQKVYGNDVEVNFVEMAKADVLTKLHTVLASGVKEDLPDIVLISDLNAQGY